MMKAVFSSRPLKHLSVPGSHSFIKFSKMCNSIQKTKSELRLEIKNKLKTLSEMDKLKQTFIITARLINHPDFQRAKRVAVYVNMKNEVGTYDILKEAFSQDKKVYIPLVTGDLMKMVRLNSFDELRTMSKTKWGIIQPEESDNREDCLETGGVEYVVVPGVAFTSDGKRLGHGKGYYDRFLEKNDKLRESRCITVGLGFDEQIVENLPCTEKDFQLTWVINPKMCELFSKHLDMPTNFTPPPEPFTI